MSMTVKLSDYERALNQLNELPLKQARIFSVALASLRQQRDEARAEVERLHRMLPVHPSSLTDACTDAYQRGAEAMREACAGALLADGLVLSRERAANVVRALPIPEDK